jgi:squalene-associated FAD-dependent desaturase
MGCCTNLITLMQNVGLSHAFTRYRELTFHHRDYPQAKFDKPHFLPAPLHLLPSLLRLPYLTWKQRFEIAYATTSLMRTRASDMKSVAAAQWLTRHKQSPDTVRNYWEVVVASALGESCDRVSMAAVRKVFIDGFLAHRDASDVLVPNVPLAQLFGTQLPNVLRKRGITIHHGTIVQSVSPTEDDHVRVTISGQPQTFAHAIVALPHFAISRVIDRQTATLAGLPENRYADVASSPITGIHLWFDKPVMEQPHAVIVDALAQWLFRRESDADSPGKHYVQVVVSASHGLRRMNNAEVIDQVVREIKQVFPRASEAKLIHGRVVTDPTSVFSLTPEVDAMRPSASTALPQLHLAGDFVQTGWPATMEGAVISGRIAASSVAQRLGLGPVSIDQGLRPPLPCRLLIR